MYIVQLHNILLGNIARDVGVASKTNAERAQHAVINFSFRL